MSGSASRIFSKRSTSASVAAMDAFCARRRSIMSSGRLEDGKNCCCTKPNRIIASTNVPAVPSDDPAAIRQRLREHPAKARCHRAFGMPWT